MSRQPESGGSSSKKKTSKKSTSKGWVVLGGKKYPITQMFGNASSRYRSGRHSGMDIGVPVGTRLYADIDGVVVTAGNKGAWGNTVVIQAADGTRHRYGHLSSIGVRVGQRVTSGFMVGKSGNTGNSTGPHLHYEVYNSRGQSIDPYRYLTGSTTSGYSSATYSTGSAAGASGNRNTTNYVYTPAGGAVAETKPKMTMADYGYVAGFVNAHPDVKKLVEAAIKGGWTPDKLQGAIKNTKWWRTRTESQRRSEIMRYENPAEYNKQIAQKKTQIGAMATSMGIKLAPATLNSLATSYVTNAASPEEMQLGLSRYWSVPKSGAAVGTAGVALAGLEAAVGQYGVGMSAATKQAYVRQIIGGQQTLEGVEDVFREQAKTLYPSVKAQLDQGMTTRQILDPFLQMAEKELGTPSSQMNLTDTKWTAPLGTKASGTQLSADEWTVKLRTDTRYGWDRTANAREQASGLIGSLSKMFGIAG